MLSFYLTGLKKIFSVGKKVLLVAVVFFVVISLFMYFINQDKPKITYDPIQKNREEMYKVINDPKLNQTKEGKITIALYRAMMCGMVGEACSNNPSDGDKNFNKSIFGFMTNLIVLPYANPPASGVYWAYSGLQNAGFIPKSYAAEGIGFGAIKPFAKVWNAFRNVAYLILVLVLISIGFMVMFRMKLNPQTVISVENALPKIVLALVLITFSFPIAGFLIDLMYIIIILIISAIGPSAGWDAAKIIEKQRLYLQAGPGTLWNQFYGLGGWLSIFWQLPTALLGLIPVVGTVVRIVGIGLGAWFLHGWLVKIPPIKNIIELFNLNIEGGIVVANVKWPGITELLKIFPEIAAFLLALYLGAVFLIPLILGLIIFLTVVFIFFRIIFILLSAYIKILLSIMIAPLYLLLEGIPGQSAFSSWLKNLISELIIFPTIITIFILVTIIVNTIDASTIIQFPFMVGIDPQNYSFIIGMAILFLTPELVNIVKRLFVPKPGMLDMAGIGTFFAGAGTGISAGLGEASKWAGIGYYVRPLGNLISKATFGLIKYPEETKPPPPGTHA